jgi:hypothetical protein
VSRCSAGSIMAGRSGFDPRQGQRIFILAPASRPALGPTQPAGYRGGSPFSGNKARPGRDADHSPPSSAEVKYEQKLYLLSPHVPPWHVAGRLYFFFTLYFSVENGKKIKDSELSDFSQPRIKVVWRETELATQAFYSLARHWHQSSHVDNHWPLSVYNKHS